MFGMIRNSLFGNTEKTEYKLLSSETKVRDVWTELPACSDTQLWVLLSRHAVFARRLCAVLQTRGTNWKTVFVHNLLILTTFEDAYQNTDHVCLFCFCA